MQTTTGTTVGQGRLMKGQKRVEMLPIVSTIEKYR